MPRGTVVWRGQRGLQALLGGAAVLGLVFATLPSAAAQPSSNDILVPSGYQISQFATGFTSATAFDRAPNGDLYVLDSGAGFGYAQGMVPPPVKVWKVSNGTPSLVYNGETQKGLAPPGLGIAVKDDDTIFVNDYSGLNRLHRDGSVQHLIDLPAKGDHADDHIAIGKDGKLYWGEGSATNSGVVGEDNESLTGWLKAHPDVRDIPCKDIVLSGQNWTSKDVLGGDPNKTITTGPYLPFGTAATPGQVVKGEVPCTSAVLRSNMDGTGLEMVAWGFRNPFGVGFAPDDSPLKGALVVSNNGSDVRGSRPIESDEDDLFVVTPGAWYGWPDYFDEVPVTEPRFNPKDPANAVAFALQSPTEQDVHGAVTHFQKGVSADGFAFSTSNDFGWKGDLFIAEWGALGFGLQPPHGLPGYDIIRVHFDADANGVVTSTQKATFITNKTQGAASTNNQNGLEHPIDVRFSADGKTMYILDYGIGGKPGTGKVWAVTRTGTGAPGGAAPPNQAAPRPTPVPPTPTPVPVQSAPPAAPPPPPAAAPPATAPEPPMPASASVAVQSFAFMPQTLTVAPGTTVTWTNNDAVPHTVTWDDRSVDSGLFGQGEAFAYTFDTPGTFGYFCIPHGSPGAGMFGTVVVSDG